MTDGAEVALGEAIGHGNDDMANLDCLLRRSKPTTAWPGRRHRHPKAVLRENLKLALSAIYIPNPERPKEATTRRLGYTASRCQPKRHLPLVAVSAPVATGAPCASSSTPVPTRTSTTRTAAATLAALPDGVPEDTKPSMELPQLKADINARDSFFGLRRRRTYQSCTAIVWTQ